LSGNLSLIWALILWILGLVLFGQELFTTETPIIDASPFLIFIFVGFGAIDLTVGIWAIVVFLKCLGQVQGFSAWKALGNVFLAGLVVIIPIVLVFLVVPGKPSLNLF